MPCRRSTRTVKQQLGTKMNRRRSAFAGAAFLATAALSTSGPAAAQDSVFIGAYGASEPSLVAEYIALALSSEQVDPETYRLLSGVVLAAEWGTWHAVLDMTQEERNGQWVVTLQVGVDDLQDDDDGWGEVWQVTLTLSGMDDDGNQRLLSTAATPIAG